MAVSEYAALPDAELLQNYWDAHAQFGPFDISPELHLKMVRSGATSKDDYIRQLEDEVSTLRRDLARQKKADETK